MYHGNHPPCLHCHPHSYIRMVQHLIERCLLHCMSRDQCIEALAQHANIQPIVALTVWRELLKENRDFFHAYYHANFPRPLISIALNYQQIQKAPRFIRKRQWRGE